MYNRNFEVGDVVICKPGFSEGEEDTDEGPMGGLGYKVGKIFTVTSFTTSYDYAWILIGENEEESIYAYACEFYEPLVDTLDKIKKEIK